MKRKLLFAQCYVFKYNLRFYEMNINRNDKLSENIMNILAVTAKWGWCERITQKRCLNCLKKTARPGEMRCFDKKKSLARTYLLYMIKYFVSSSIINQDKCLIFIDISLSKQRIWKFNDFCLHIMQKKNWKSQSLDYNFFRQ